ncbi:hypothetical protein [Mucilaginibacter sp. dw_454]|uniref:DUF6922 domain-containing protein n=1 Tax=Mucilaginibacter sp. dw_454 TaxID=2720079 RepID=UPI001BD1E82F|nr:hypothetical protein [Mucilaginibacter sp. dw_454]
MNKPAISKQAFWDVDMDNIDYEKNARFVVEKVIERGKAEDFETLLAYYGFERVKQLAQQALWLSDISINFCCTLFKIKPTDFKCYEKKQLNHQHWNF